MEDKISIFTDGSSLGNPGPGGFSAIIKKGAKKITICGGELHTTNNRMELCAIIAGLYSASKNFPQAKTCSVFSDSKLLIETMNKGWKRKKNKDLWAKLDAIVSKFTRISWNWIKGHAGHRENTEADKIAVAQARKQQRKLKTSKRTEPVKERCDTADNAQQSLFNA